MIAIKKINPINSIMFLYILSLYLFTYREGLTFVSNSIALLLISSIWVHFIIMRQKLIINKMLLSLLGFILLCAVSSFVAIDPYLAISKVITLILIFILLVSLINYIDTVEKLNKLIHYYIYAGLIASGYIVISTDFTEITRIGTALGNVNAVGIILGISATFSFYLLMEEKKYRYLLYIAVMLPLIFITGSRKSLLFIIINIIMILFFKNSRSLKNIMKFILISLIILLIIFYLIYHVEFFYLILGTRMENFFAFITGKGTSEESLNMRNYMVEFGLDVFRNRPWFGYGIDNYRVLLGREIGYETYSHNNFIELLVGTGILGVLTYYLTHFYVLKSFIKSYINYPRLTIYYPFMSIVISFSLLSIALVYYDDKHISIILAVGSVIHRIVQNDKPDVSSVQHNKKERYNRC